jgi:hypothetical protein
MSEEASLKGVFAVGVGVLRRSAWCVCMCLKRWGGLKVISFGAVDSFCADACAESVLFAVFASARFTTMRLRAVG